MDSGAVALSDLSQRPVVIASHPRSGTHLTIDLLRRQFRECRSWKLPGEKLNRLYLDLNALFDPASRSPVDDRKALAILRRVPCPLVKTHLRWHQLEAGAAGGNPWLQWLIRRGRFVYVYRDVRDVMCSYHFFCMIDERGRRPLAEFIRQESDGASRVRGWVDHVTGWRGRPGVHELRFEDLVRDPAAMVAKLAEHLGLEPLNRTPVLPRRFRGVWESRMNRLLGWRPACTAIISRYKGHRLERWREAFTRDDRAFVQREAGDLLRELGYERSPEWVEDAGVTGSPRGTAPS